jgi:type I restriction enzyme, S subunit
MSDELPPSWCSTRGDDLFEVVRGVTYAKPQASDRPHEGRTAIYRAGNLQGGQILESDLVWVESDCVDPEQILRPGDLVVAMSSGSPEIVGKVAAYPGSPTPRSFGAFCGGIRPTAHAVAQWLRQFFQSKHYRQTVSDLAAGVNINNLKRDHLESLQIPLPPEAEQRRIVAKLDALQSRTRLAREALAAIPTLLDHYRQSVLAAAFRGELTAGWRLHNRADPDEVDAALEGMRLERRKGWYRRGPYIPPAEPLAENAPEIPDTWRWATWDLLSSWITYGFTRPMPHTKSGIPIITAKNVVGGRLDLDEVHLTPESNFNALSDKDRPEYGDLLMTKDGAIGRAALVPKDFKFCINQSVAVIQLRHCTVDREYLLYAAQAPMTQTPILELAKGMAIQHLSITDLAKLAIPIPPLAEQRALVAKLNHALHLIDSVGEVLPQLLRTASHLDQSILATAFRGELVPQDPADEPAAALLDRIRAARAQAGDTPRTRRPRTSPPARAAGPTTPYRATAGDDYATVLTALRTKGSISSADAQVATGLDAAGVRPLLQRLITERAAKVEGQKRGTRYVSITAKGKSSTSAKR